MEHVLVSACLLGQAVRYNGGDKRCDDDILQRLEAGTVPDQMPATLRLVIIHTASGMYLSRRADLSWREFQSLWPDFQTSLGPWNAEAIIDYLDQEYPDLRPSARLQVQALRCASEDALRLSFRD